MGTKTNTLTKNIRKEIRKEIANVYLPYLNTEECENINRIIRIMSESDEKLNKQYNKKSIGGMINFNYVKEGEEKEVEEEEESDEESEGEEEDDEEKNDILHKYDIIYNSFGEVNNINIDIWRSRLEKVKEYIDRNGKRPSNHSKDNEIKKLGKWICTNIKNYKKKQCIMKDENIRISWKNLIESYPHIFNSS